jgi:hypothetical protein
MHVICKLGDADGFSTLIIKGARVTSIDDVSVLYPLLKEAQGLRHSLVYAMHRWQWVNYGIFHVGLL